MRQASAVILLIALVAGCAANDQTATSHQAAAGGALLGALLGNALGDDTKSTVIGAAVGGAAGLALGNAVARRKAAYASKEDLIEGETALVEQRTTAAKAYNRKLQREIAALDREIVTHRAAAARGNLDVQRSLKLKREAANKLKAADTELVAVEQELGATRTLYADASSSTRTRGLEQWQQTVEDLEEERAELTALIDDLKRSSRRI